LDCYLLSSCVNSHTRHWFVTGNICNVGISLHNLGYPPHQGTHVRRLYRRNTLLSDAELWETINGWGKLQRCARNWNLPQSASHGARLIVVRGADLLRFDQTRDQLYLTSLLIDLLSFIVSLIIFICGRRFGEMPPFKSSSPCPSVGVDSLRWLVIINSTTTASGRIDDVDRLRSISNYRSFFPPENLRTLYYVHLVSVT